MVLGTMAEPDSEDRAVVILDGEYEIYAGEKLLLLSPDGRSTVSEILAVDGAKIEVDAKEVASLRIAANSNVFVGLMEN